MKALGVLVLLALSQDPGPWRIIYQTERMREFCSYKSVLEDGSGLRDEDNEPQSPFGWSPDRKRRLFTLVKEQVGAVAYFDADSGREILITNHKTSDYSPCWSADGKQIIFASNRSGRWQIWIMDADGRNPKQLTDHPDGAAQPRVAGARIAYVRPASLPWEKPKSSTLVTMNMTGDDVHVIMEKVNLLEHEWNPKGDLLACSVPRELQIVDAPSGKIVKRFKMDEIHKDLSAHAAYRLLWRPDGRSLACIIGTLEARWDRSGRFGDNQIFILPLEGKPSIIETGGPAGPWRWIR